MGVEQILHANKGDGETSYYHNSSYQKRLLLRARQFLEGNIAHVWEQSKAECLKVADLGCSSGPNSLFPIWEMVESIDSSCVRLNMKPPVFQVFLNDLPGTDFNMIFGSLVPKFHRKLVEKNKDRTPETCVIGAMPGSFYMKLFPDNSMHFIHSSCALQWRSQVPEGLVTEAGETLNKGNICLSKSSPRIVHELYSDQFTKDFTTFIKLRSQELIAGGGMVLTIPCQRTKYPYYNSEILELIGLSLQDLVIEGQITQFMLDSFNLPCYSPAREEVRKVIENDGSFVIHGMEEFEVGWFDECKEETPRNKGKFVAKHIRAMMESLIASYFGDSIIEDLFNKFAMKVEKGIGSCNFLAVSLTKKSVTY